MKIKKKWGFGLGGQGGCERRIEDFAKIWGAFGSGWGSGWM